MDCRALIQIRQMMQEKQLWTEMKSGGSGRPCRAPGRFSPEWPGGAMSNFLHVTLTSEAMLEWQQWLDGPRSLGPR